MNRRNLLKSLLLAPLAPLVGKIAVASPIKPRVDYWWSKSNKWVIALAGYKGPEPCEAVWMSVPRWLPMPEWAKEFPENSPSWWSGRYQVDAKTGHFGSFFVWAEAKDALRKALLANDKATVFDKKSSKIAYVDRGAIHQLSQRRLADETRT
jgi:hypothetical protein